MKKQLVIIFIVFVLVFVFFSCEELATLVHGEKPEPPTVTHTVTFEANGAEGNAPLARTVKDGEVIQLPNIGSLINGGNNFVGWSESATIGVGTTLFVGDSVTVSGDMTFYAQWIASGSTQYTISFNANGASGAPPPSRIVYSGVQIKIPDQGSLGYTGRMFGGWNTEADSSGTLLGANSLYTATGSIVLYAQWYSLTDTFTVTYDVNGGDGTVPTEQTVNAGSAINLSGGTSLSKDGFIFGGWNTNAAGTGDNYSAGYLYTVISNVTLYAKWESFFSSVAEVSAYLASQSGGFDPDDTVYLPIQMNLGNMTQSGSGWRQLLNIIASSGRYVDLDLSACTMTGTEFDPDSNVATGKEMIVSITLPDTVTSITGSFSNFTELRSFYGSNLTSIGDVAFYMLTSLTMTELPAGLTSIGDYAFYYCTNLVLTTLPAGLASLGRKDENNLYTDGGKTFAGCASLVLTELPVGLTFIGEESFLGCTGLTQITLPASLTSIGRYAFMNTTNLTSITVDGNNPNYTSENGILYNKTKTELIEAPRGIIGATIIPNSVTSIGNGAFAGCIRLTSITLGNSVKFIGDNAFAGCIGLASVTFLSVIPSDGFFDVGKGGGFPGDLLSKYLDGGPGTYTTTNPGGVPVWTKQP